MIPRPLFFCLIVLLSQFHSWAIDTEATGFIVTAGNSKAVDVHGNGRLVDNTAGTKDIFVPTKSVGEWNDFLANLPVNVSVSPLSGPPTSLSISHTANNKSFTVSWTAGAGNGGAGGCKLQYLDYKWSFQSNIPLGSMGGTTGFAATTACNAGESGNTRYTVGGGSDPSAQSSWTAWGGGSNDSMDQWLCTDWHDITDGASMNCDANASSISVDLNDPMSLSWGGITVRIVRVSDSAVMDTFATALTCSTIAKSATATPSVDEDCDGRWDNQYQWIASAPLASFEPSGTSYDPRQCNAGTSGLNGTVTTSSGDNPGTHTHYDGFAFNAAESTTLYTCTLTSDYY